jgi:hypothetical protein
LLQAYLPMESRLDFVSLGLPRPLPILPLLIHRGLYMHHPGGPKPNLADLLSLLAVALTK